MDGLLNTLKFVHKIFVVTKSIVTVQNWFMRSEKEVKGTV